MRYVNRLLDETDPHVAKMTALNLGYQAAFAGTKKIRKMREIENCNIPWLILMDPTSACNLHCTGCCAAEYGHKLNLTFDELDNIVTQTDNISLTHQWFSTGHQIKIRSEERRGEGVYNKVLHAPVVLHRSSYKNIRPVPYPV